MRIFKLFSRKRTEEPRRGLDFYQESIEKVGRDQIKKMIDRDLSIPVFVL